MRRRAFITLLGGAAAAWPLAGRAQQAGKVPRIGFLGATSAFGLVGRIDGFRQGLRDRGYVEGTNILIDYRWADGNYGRLPELALDLVRSKVDLIVTHTTPGALAAKQATTTIPIVVAIVGDPVASGVVASLARPGGNITGQSFFNPELRAKRIESAEGNRAGHHAGRRSPQPGQPCNRAGAAGDGDDGTVARHTTAPIPATGAERDR